MGADRTGAPAGALTALVDMAASLDDPCFYSVAV